MAQAKNKLYSRAEIRNEITDLRNDAARIAMSHRDAFRSDANHDEIKCVVCLNWGAKIEAYERAIRHFGGRH